MNNKVYTNLILSFQNGKNDLIRETIPLLSQIYANFYDKQGCDLFNGVNQNLWHQQNVSTEYSFSQFEMTKTSLPLHIVLRGSEQTELSVLTTLKRNLLGRSPHVNSWCWGMWSFCYREINSDPTSIKLHSIGTFFRLQKIRKLLYILWTNPQSIQNKDQLDIPVRPENYG